MGTELCIRAEGGEWPQAVVSPETFLERLARRACFAEVPVIASAVVAGGLELRRARADANVCGELDVPFRPNGYRWTLWKQ